MTALVASVSPDREWVEVRARGASPHEIAAQLRTLLPPTAQVRVAYGAARVAPSDLLPLVERGPGMVPAFLNREVIRFVQNRTRRSDVDDVGACHALRELSIDAVRRLVADATPGLLRRLDDHQLRNVAIMTIPESPGACVFDEQGTGKTLSVVTAFDVLVDRGEAEVLLVVAPKSMVGEWRSEIVRFCGGLYRVEVLEGTRRQRAAALSSGADVFVLNYETVVALPDDLRLLCMRHRTVLIADESFAVKNPSAHRTEALTALREWCVRAYALCGTPAPNDAADVVSQVTFVDFGRAFGQMTLPQDGDARRACIREVMGDRVVYTRNLKSVVLPHLPGRVHTDLEVPLQPRQRALYIRIAGQLARELEDISDEQFRTKFANYLARRSALLRACSDPAGVDPSHDELPAKFLALDRLLAGWMASREKVVVWSFYRDTLDQLQSRYAHLGVVRVDGSVTEVAARREAVRAFQSSQDVRVFIGNPAAAGAGITLHAARLAVYESMSNQAAHYLQSLDRIHRRGQSREVEYVTLACKDTIEQAEYQRLRAKAALQSDLLGDPHDPALTRAMMLEELVSSLDRIATA